MILSPLTHFRKHQKMSINLSITEKPVLNIPPAIHQPDALIGFDTLPDSARVRLPVVCRLLGVSRATVYRMVKAGTLKSYKLTARTTTFCVAELRALLTSQVGVQNV